MKDRFGGFFQQCYCSHLFPPSLPLPLSPASSLTPRVPGGIFFIHERFVLQHAAAICEWIFTVTILVFYGTFTYEFGALSSDSVLAALQPRGGGGTGGGKDCKSPGSSSTSTHLNCYPESIAML
ncbi:UNVERIFIED_CONTAM: hypothetical protein FKN15_046080 [Acipenser sinensis]